MGVGKENRRGKTVDLRPFFLFVLIVLMIAGPILSDMERSREPVRFSNKPVISTEFEDIRIRAVSQIVEAGEFLYILPDKQEGFIQVYDLNGAYLHSLFFTEISNGDFVMVCEDGLLYVQNQTGDVFVFRDGEFQECVKRADAKERFAHIGFVRQGSTPGYLFRGTDLWFLSDGEERLVISDLVTFDTRLAVIVLTVLLVAGFVLAGFRYWKRRRMDH